jgi:hypothetical protein
MNTRSVIKLLFALQLFLISGICGAQVLLTVKESAINKLATRIGPISDSGHHNVYVPFTCFHCTERVAGVCVWGYFSSCQVKIYSADWRWTVSNIRFNITSSGITYTGSLSAHYGALPTYSTSVNGTASVSASGRTIELALTRISIPIRFDVPIAGRVTVTTINRTPPYGQAVNLYEIPLRREPPEGAAWTTVFLKNLQREYGSGELRIKARLEATGG